MLDEMQASFLLPENGETERALVNQRRLLPRKDSVDGPAISHLLNRIVDWWSVFEDLECGHTWILMRIQENFSGCRVCLTA